jgi:hypothetical protein
MRLSTATFVVVVAGLVQNCAAWGAAGHEIAATVAQMHLHPSVLPKLCLILNPPTWDPSESESAPECHLAPIAAWADRIRFRMRWSAQMHYVGALGDHPSDTCLFPGDRGWAGREGNNVFGGIRNTTNIVSTWKDGEEDNVNWPLMNEAFKFLVHFMGDMHMPLHLTGRDRGGNSDKVLFDGRQTNLHSLWDGLLIAKSLRTQVPRNYTLPLPYPQVEQNLRGAIYDPYIRRLIHEGVLGKWKDEIPSWFECPASSSSHKPTTTSTEEEEYLFANSDQTEQRVLRTSGATIPDGTDDDLVCPYFWAQPIHALNCAIVWPKALDEPPYNQHLSSHSHSESDSHSCASPTLESLLSSFDHMNRFTAGRKGGPYLELDTPEYTGYIQNEWIVEKLLTMAGIRLAGILNYVFADQEGDEFVSRARGLWIPDLEI